LHDRRDVGRSPLDHYLLNTPDQAQPQHHLQGKSIGAAPGGAHLETSTSQNMAVARQLKQSPSLLVGQAVPGRISGCRVTSQATP
jgi:hypothetical protein